MPDLKASGPTDPDRGGGAAGTGKVPSRERVEVRRQVSESGTLKITVVSYSDGSSDTFNELKADRTGSNPFNDAHGLLNLGSDGSSRLAAGLIIDRTA